MWLFTENQATFSGWLRKVQTHQVPQVRQEGEHVYREEHTVPFTQQLHWLAHRNLRTCYLIWRAHKLSSSRSSYTQQMNHFTCVFQFGGLQIQKLHLQSFEMVPCVHSHASSLLFSTDSITLTSALPFLPLLHPVVSSSYFSRCVFCIFFSLKSFRAFLRG